MRRRLGEWNEVRNVLRPSLRKLVTSTGFDTSRIGYVRIIWTVEMSINPILHSPNLENVYSVRM
jgi:hypothetical protein